MNIDRVPAALLPILKAELSAAHFNFDEPEASLYASLVIDQLSTATPRPISSTVSQRIRSALDSFKQRLEVTQPDWRYELLDGLKSIGLPSTPNTLIARRITASATCSPTCSCTVSARSAAPSIKMAGQAWLTPCTGPQLGSIRVNGARIIQP
jgi:hypothetical protein